MLCKVCSKPLSTRNITGRCWRCSGQKPRCNSCNDRLVPGRVAVCDWCALYRPFLHALHCSHGIPCPADVLAEREPLYTRRAAARLPLFARTED